MRIPIPINGITDATAFIDTPEGFCQPGAMVNMVPYDPDRPRLSKRPGLRKTFPTRLGREGNRRIQGLKAISRASAVTAFALGEATPITRANAFSRNSELIDFNAFALATQPLYSIADAFKVYGSGGQAKFQRAGAAAAQNLICETAEFPNTASALWTAISPDGTMGCIAFSYTTSASQVRCALVFVDPLTGDLIGSKVIAPVGENPAAQDNIAAIGFTWTDRGLWVARGTALWYVATPVRAGRARLGSPDQPLALLAAGDSDFSFATVASRIVSMATFLAGGTRYLLAAFVGSPAPGLTANPVGAIEPGAFARHFRAGVFRLVETAGATGALGFTTDASIVRPAEAFDPYVEISDAAGATPTAHRSLRFSQELDRAPRGCIPTAIAAAPGGAFAVAFTNQGYGPSSAHTPNAQAVPCTTIAKFDFNGTKRWEWDTQSPIPAEAGGKRAGVGTTYACDIPDEDGGNAGTTSKDGPAIRALAMSPSGLVFAGGRVNGGLFCTFCLEPASGQLRWRRGLESQNSASHDPVGAGAAGRGVPRNGMALDESDGNVFVVAARNNTWPTTTVASSAVRPYASMFRLSPVDGELLEVADPAQDTTGSAPSCCACVNGHALVGGTTFTDS